MDDYVRRAQGDLQGSDWKNSPPRTRSLTADFRATPAAGSRGSAAHQRADGRYAQTQHHEKTGHPFDRRPDAASAIRHSGITTLIATAAVC